VLEAKKLLLVAQELDSPAQVEALPAARLGVNLTSNEGG
jgi:hypothetical protein